MAPHRQLLCDARRGCCIAAAGMLLAALGGCAATGSRVSGDDSLGRVFYVDGAGGGGLLMNWGGGVLKGLQEAGLKGGFREFDWQTGLGVATDHGASVAYKRAWARKLAEEILEYRQAHPQGPIYVIALSAGTAVATFALEALPDDCEVDAVVLLSSSMSSHYDLTAALRHVRGRLHVFVSAKDSVLSRLVPLVGTADREFCGTAVAGLVGFERPQNDGADAPRSYAKVQTVAWNPEFEATGHHGGHTDAVGAAFVSAQVAPLLQSEDRIALAGKPWQP